MSASKSASLWFSSYLPGFKALEELVDLSFIQK